MAASRSLTGLIRAAGRPSPLSPAIFFPALWGIGVLLAWLVPMPAYDLGAWSPRAWLVMIAVPVAFVLGCVISRILMTSLLDAAGVAAFAPERRTDAVATPRRMRVVLICALIVGYAELAHQFIGAGAIPLLSSNIDVARFAQPGGPSIILTNLLPVVAILALASRRSLRLPAALPEMCIAAIAIGGFLLAANRGIFVLTLAAAAAARALLYGMPRPRTVVVGGLSILVVLVGVFFLRTSQPQPNTFTDQLHSRILPAMPVLSRPYAAIHFGYATNFDVLARVVDHFPGSEPYGRGAFSTSAFDLVIPGTRALTSETPQLTGAWVTATVAGPFWADGGFPFLLLGMTAIGAVASALYTAALRTRWLAVSAAAGYGLFLTAFGVYTNLWTDQPDWTFVFPMIVVLALLGGGHISSPRFWRESRAAERAGKRAPRYALARLRFLPLLKSKPFLVSAGALATMLVAALLWQPSDKQDVTTATEPPPTLSVAESLPLDTIATAQGSTLATDGAAPGDNTPIWSIRGVGSEGVARRIDFDDVRPRHEQFSVRLSSASRTRALDVADWEGRPAVFDMQRQPSGITTRVVSLSDGDATTLQAFSALTQPRVRRDVSIATWDGRLPDLFVMDNLGSRERLRISIFSGESGFTRIVARARASLVRIDPAQWSFDVATLNGSRPEVIALRRGVSPSSYTEVHVLTGESRFKKFALHGTLKTPRGVSTEHFASGLSLGLPSVFLVAPRRILTVRVPTISSR